MAVYAYPYHHCIVWEAELGRRKLPFGQFRENLTIAGLGEDSTRVGDLFRIGTALFRITQPRIPCRPRLSPVRCHRPSQPARGRGTGVALEQCARARRRIRNEDRGSRRSNATALRNGVS